MKEANVFNLDVDTRVDKAIIEEMDIYINKLVNGFIEVGLEATFQLHLSGILDDLLQIHTYEIDERFQVALEKNMPINGNKNYVDIVIKYTKNTTERLHLFELKYKKESDGAPDNGIIYSYIDMCNLDYHKVNTPKVKGCYFIFLTDSFVYTKNPRPSTTRAQLPMHHGAMINSGFNYNVSGNSAKSIMGTYMTTGFEFSNSHSIQYQKFSIKNKEFWFFKEKI
ncbi:MAG TPA: hypothetical protein GX708_02255 [Gallicola sp.]|nr:hypothetical protein [Gallicola sp.]